MRKNFFLFSIFSLLVFLNLSARKTLKNYKDEYFIILNSLPVSLENLNFQKNEVRLYELEEKVKDFGGKVLDSYLHAFVGVHVRMEVNEIELLSQDEHIKFIEKNGIAYPFREKELSRSWGLDRSDQRDLPLNQEYRTPYTGVNTHAYIIDTGLRASHEEFLARVGQGYSALKDDPSTDDCNGHGTHVAGTVLGKTSGIARKAIVHPVRVFACNGGASWDVIINAIDWVIKNHQKPALINMSLGGGGNKAIDEAVENAVKSGISVVVAAGNSNANACDFSPARTKNAITVAASTDKDIRASFSNWGACVDVFAPGQAIVSASHSGDNVYRSLSGTSMASPHVAGAVSLVLSIYPKWSPEQVQKILARTASFEKIKDPKESINKLLYVNDLGGIPTVDAGDDVVQRLPKNKLILKGVASDQDGYITETTWMQLAGPHIALASKSFDWQQNLILDGLSKGAYLFRFSAWDNEGLFAYDDVSVLITDRNLSPIAHAGKDQRVSLKKKVWLDAEKSHDLDGEISAYTWSQVSGPSTANITEPLAKKTLINDLISGSYLFKIMVTDNENLSSEDEVKIYMNHPPKVDAGEDKKIDLPQDKVFLLAKASDADGTVLKYLWVKEEGPDGEEIKNPRQASTEIKNLQEGTYIFRIYVIDDMNEQASDTVTVLVENTNKQPLVSAGEDKIITLPLASVTLKGVCTDPDGWCMSTGWKLVERSRFSFTNLSQKIVSSDLQLENLSAGTYKFVFTGVDNLGLQASDDVLLTVK